jgi:hypothetical protein
MECALRKNLATPTKLGEHFGGLSVDWRTSNMASFFLETAFHKLASKAEGSWVSLIAGKTASATLVTVPYLTIRPCNKIDLIDPHSEFEKRFGTGSCVKVTGSLVEYVKWLISYLTIIANAICEL